MSVCLFGWVGVVWMGECLLFIWIECLSLVWMGVWVSVLLVWIRDARYTGTVKLPVFIIFQTVRYHNFAQFGIS